MSARPFEVRLHAKLYRARAVAEAVSDAAGAFGGELRRSRDGDHHVVEASGAGEEEAREVLARVANAALVLTVIADPQGPGTSRRPQPSER